MRGSMLRWATSTGAPTMLIFSCDASQRRMSVEPLESPMAKITREHAAQEIVELRRQIEHHNYQYYVRDNPEISDADYDRMFRRLVELEQEQPDLASGDSPTQKVGAPPLEKFTTGQHTTPMLSLNDAMDEEKLLDFEARIQRFLKRSEAIEYAIEP